MQFETYNINQLQVIIAPMQESNSVTVEILAKAGSNYETIQNNGISHFLEHMFFKGGRKYKTPKAVAETIDAVGGEFNAFTSGLYAGYYVKCAPDYINKAIDVLGDMLVNAQFPKEELEREKSVIIQEIMMKNDDPSSLVYDKRKLFYFGDTSYGRSTLGPIKNIQNFTQEDLFAHKNNLYTKDNMVIVITGKVESIEDIKKLIEETFSNLPAQRTIKEPNFIHNLPTKKQSYYKKQTEQNHLIISAQGFSGNTNEKYQASILATILGGNMSSRLFQNIREKQGLCYYIGGAHYSMPHTGIFLFRAGIEKQRFDFALEKIHEEINNISNGDFSIEEFNKALGYRKGQLQMGIESSDEMASFLGEQYLLYNKIETLDEILDKLNKQTPDDIKKIANKLSHKNLYSYRIQ